MEIASRRSGIVDLHVHSTASDGSSTPLEIIEAAKNSGLQAIAITDHDTVEGSAEALRSPQGPALEVLSGIEISADFLPGTMHMLGYLIRLDDPALRQTLERVQASRANRNLQIVEKLQNFGIDIDYEDVLKVSGGGQVGRPHIAQVLVQKGAVQSIDGAFGKLLKKNGPAYVPRFRLSPAEAINMILQAGGVPVLAHPFTLHTKNEAELEGIVADLKRVGLRGLEVYYPEHGRARTAQYERLALGHDLLITGGTDFHGASKPQVHLGIGRGDMRVPYRCVEELKNSRA
jgi:predicted metal-dependent phosphoesterase TrpH